MKMKTLAMVAASGLLAVSLAYITPALAEEGFDDGMGGQQLAMADTGSAGIPSDAINGNTNVASNNNIDNVNNAPAPAATVNPGQQQAVNTAANNTNSAAPTAVNDQPVADVASGDEDF